MQTVFAIETLLPPIARFMTIIFASSERLKLNELTYTVYGKHEEKSPGKTPRGKEEEQYSTFGASEEREKCSGMNRNKRLLRDRVAG